MSNPSALGAICYEAESAFGEDITTFATLRIPTVGPPDISGLKQDKIDSQRTVQYRNDGTAWILGVKGGTVKTKIYLTGHGSTTSGATTLGGVETLLGKVFGNAAASAASGTTLTGGTATIPLTTASATFSAGSLCAIGSANDARGNGQAAAIATHITTSLTLLTAIDGTPNAADVLYSAVNIYPSETGYTVNSIRLLFQTANLQYELHGCYPTEAVFAGLNPGEIPTLEITWTVAWHRYSTATFPSAVATETFQPSPVAAGSLFVNDVGTATRAKRTCRSFTLSYKLGMEMLPGPGSPDANAVCIGARRTPDDIRISWTEDADAATTTPVLPGFATATTKKHVLYTLNPTIGARVAFYFPQVTVTAVPFQMADRNINRLKFDGECNTGPTTTNDLTASAFRMAWM